MKPTLRDTGCEVWDGILYAGYCIPSVTWKASQAVQVLWAS